ncbi:MAG TPA: cupin domain-containing protein [Gaiellaceae bacterium]|nr:cupin domain-containing protein [Gaiellaceae bacterium]
MGTDAQSQVTVIRPPSTEQSRQGVPQFFGVGETTSAATGISMNLTSFPPGASAEPHAHRDFETAIYTVSGRIALFYGERLEEHAVLEPGTFCFIPPGVPHKPYNLSLDEPAAAVVARNDPREQENVVLTPEADDGTPDRTVEALRARA